MTTEPVRPTADLEDVISEAYSGQERHTTGELQRRALAADLPSDAMARIDALPEGEYLEDEALEALRQVSDLTPELDDRH